MKEDTIVDTHLFTFDEKSGGEALIFETKIISNGDEEDGVYLDQNLTLMSYCNSANFNLVGTPLTPKLLRKLANELEIAIKKAKSKNKKEK